MPRSRAIIVRDGAVALIERRRDGRLYYVFPGGGGEGGETPEAAALREVREELGLLVEIGGLVATFRQDGDLQFFFLATIAGGSFGAGDGPEMRGQRPPERGIYAPIWLPVGELLARLVFPRAVARLVADAMTDGWPSEPLSARDDGDA
jgi:8-oxo-dGTP pyrophosphatase MutT (NUDIX family)